MKKSTTSTNLTDEQLKELKRNACGILADARMNFQRQFPFVGSISMQMDLVPTRDKRNPTASTDGSTIFFDIAFLSSLSRDEQMFVLGHEVYHVVMMHSLRCEGRDRELFNIAADMEVNGILKADGLIPPADALLPNKFGFDPDQSSEDYYELLIRNAKSSGGGSGSSGSGMPADGKSNGTCSGQFDTHIGKDDDISESSGPSEATDRYGKVGYDDDFNPNVSPKDIERVRQAAVAAAQQIERTRGSLPGHLQRLVDKLLKPEISWKEVLIQFTTRTSGCSTTWTRPNRRFVHTGTYLPSHEGQALKIAIGLDTSGSTSEDMNKFLSEVNGIAKSFSKYDIDLIQCDYDVQSVDHYDESNPLFDDGTRKGFKVHGGGGTRMKPIFDYIKVNDLDVDAVVVFTDGYIEKMTPADDPGIPVLWILTKNSTDDCVKAFGEVVKFAA
jgi:predicted metal-dependent peptidase